MRIFPAWMYRDPAEAAERIETSELRAETRARIRELERQEEIRRVQDLLFGRLGVGSTRVIFAPPEIRLKRARIQRLAREAMRERK